MATIVIAEDDPDIREISALLLRKAGHTTIPAGDGAEGWQAVLNYSPDLVISDIDMPETDGLALCAQIRAHPATARVPVICISGVLMPGDTCVEQAGGTALLHKPFASADLLDQVRSVLTTTLGAESP
ncbi:response regulator [Actinoplanes sp. L3-i22]|uniref:response regulator n=1 Tax=Actinoplanes sp. L3-i22 TaxID=2836373 RepID=UPI001C76622C|nr:response regulator [Actinoplanes sp. L3-i22]BCY08364.1 hypothetical protein L3i22_034520 [Actinoplanes sp. L3-i22]